MPASSRRRSPSVPKRRPRDSHRAGAGLLDGLGDRRRAAGQAIAERSGLAQQLGLLGLEDRRHRSCQAVERVCRLHALGAERERDLARGDVARSELDADGHAAQLPLDDAPADRDVGVRVELGADPGAREVIDQPRGLLDDALAGPRHQHDDLDGRDPRRQAQAVVVAVDHDRRAQQSRGGAPGRLPRALHARRARPCRRCRRRARSSGPARATCPSAAPCRRASALRTTMRRPRRRTSRARSCARARPGSRARDSIVAA